MYLSLFTEESAQALSSADETASLAANAEQSLSTIQKWLTSGYNWFISYLPNLISGLIIFVVGWWLTKLLFKLLLKAMTKGKADPTVATFLHSIINLALKTIVIICVLSTVGFDVTTIITTLGAAAVTIGLALKDSLSNVASGTLIILNKKFKIGDYLETEGLKGVVKKIDISTSSTVEITVPSHWNGTKVDIYVYTQCFENADQKRALYEAEIYAAIGEIKAAESNAKYSNSAYIGSGTIG